MINRFREKDLDRYEKRKDGKPFKKWLQKKEEDLNGANNKCPGCKSVAGARTGLIKKGLDYLWEEFQDWFKGKFSSVEKPHTTAETGNSSDGNNNSNEVDEDGSTPVGPPGPGNSADPGNTNGTGNSTEGNNNSNEVDENGSTPVGPPGNGNSTGKGKNITQTDLETVMGTRNSSDGENGSKGDDRSTPIDKDKSSNQEDTESYSYDSEEYE